jgi:UDP-GlcNAc:undecaprenyl-phosphate GlcNAc-1-phosphate transferase
VFNLPAGTPLLWVAPLLVAFVSAVLLTPVAERVAIRYRVMDKPIGQKIHKLPMPLLGGLAVYAAFVIASALFLPLKGPVLGIVVGGGVAVAVGIIDDRFNLSPLVHLAGQFLAAVVTVVVGVGIVRFVSIPWGPLNGHYCPPHITAAHQCSTGSWQVPAVIGLAFTLLWMVGMMNAVNFLDGLDGLSTGVCAITAALLAVWASHLQNFIANPTATFHHADFLLPTILLGALLGFLPFNWHPARIFIGDSGVMFVGLGLATFSILGPAKIGLALLVLAIPILDVAWAIVRRQLAGRSFLAGDKQHVYHRMLELGMSHTSTVLSLYALCLALAVADYAATKLVKLAAFAVVTVVTIIAFIYLEVAGNHRHEQIRPRKPAKEAG